MDAIRRVVKPDVLVTPAKASLQEILMIELNQLQWESLRPPATSRRGFELKNPDAIAWMARQGTVPIARHLMLGYRFCSKFKSPAFEGHRGRTASFPTAPSQIPACGFLAQGSSVLFASYKSISVPISNNPGTRYLELLKQFSKSAPVVALTLAATVKPFEDDSASEIIKGIQHFDIA